MKQEDSLIKKYGKDSGMKVPENYFPELEARIMESLPPYVAAPKAPELSRWQRMKPYVYLAAMFMGIWLMMKVFHTVSRPMSLSLDNPPEALVELIDKDDYEDYAMLRYYDFGDEEDVILSYDSIEDFEKAFNSN